MLLWTGFVVCTALIVYSGTRLSKYGDIIAEKTGIGGAWIGLVLMASVTSLPELVTGISSVTYADAPDIAVGDILGSCVFNMLILSILDAIYRQMPISSKAHHGHVLSGSLGILLICIVVTSLFTRDHTFSVGWIGVYSILIGIIYLTGLRLVFFFEKREIARYMKGVAVELKYSGLSTKTAAINYGINAVIVIASAVLLPVIGKGIAETTGLGQTFASNIFIAMSTSLPEVVISVSAIRLGSIDLAIGNLFGSNLFNIVILAIDDMFYLDGPILSSVSQNHIISAMSAIAMITIAIIGLTYRAEKKPLLLAWDSTGILIVYILNVILLYIFR